MKKNERTESAALPFPGLRHEELGLFTTHWCVGEYRRYIGDGITPEKAVRKIAGEKQCTRCLVIEVLINAGEKLPRKFEAMAHPRDGFREAAFDEMPEDAELGKIILPEWAAGYLACDTIHERREWIKAKAREQDRSPYDVADELRKRGAAVPQTMTPEYQELRKVWGKKGGAAGGAVLHKRKLERMEREANKG